MTDLSDYSLDIKAKAPFPAGALSNFAPHSFVIDGVVCGSMEGFLQGLKAEDLGDQTRICGLAGTEAQKAGRLHDWSIQGTLWWKGHPIDRLSEQYQDLLDRAYEALYSQSRKFQDALKATGTATLTHRSGKSDPCETILTEEEFCRRLLDLRKRLAIDAKMNGQVL